MQLNTMVLIIGVIGFTFGIGVVIYTHLIKNRDALSSVFDILEDLQKAEKKTIILVEQNAKKGLEFADIGYVLVSGQTAIAGKGDDLLKNPDVGRLFLGG